MSVLLRVSLNKPRRTESPLGSY